MTDCIRKGTALLAALLLTACGSVARVPEDSFYRIAGAAPAAQTVARPLQGGLIVQGGATAPLYRDRALLFSAAGSAERVQRYHYHYWADSPPRMVQRGLADHLRAARAAAPVLMTEDGQDARYRLRVDIERFEHVRGAGNGRVEVALRLTLADRMQGVRLQDVLHTSVPVEAGDFAAVVAAYEQALTDLYRKITQRLAAQD